MALLVLTLVGPDRPGLVSTLSATVAGCGGSWLESEMARLAGQFAGILLVSVPDANAGALATELRSLEGGDLHVTVQPAGTNGVPQPHRALRIELVGQDRPGIVRDLARVLAEQRVNIEDLTTSVTSGAFTGEQVFTASACLRVPEEVETETLKSTLERLGDDLMVDIRVDEAATPAT